MQKISKSKRDTEKIAGEFTDTILKKKNLLSATVVCLFGDLGTGKTFFTQSVAKNLGIKRKVNSPTFVIIKNYELRITNYKKLIHIDAYRLKNEKELLHLGWKEIISDPKHLVFVEWPGNVIKAIPKKHHKVSIFHTLKGHRKFKIKRA